MSTREAPATATAAPASALYTTVACAMWIGMAAPPASAQHWERAALTSRPGIRSDMAICYDEARDVVLVFGGATGGGSILGDLLEWNGSAWRQVPSTNGPSPRRYAQMAYDPVRRRVVLFGGQHIFTGPYGDTWEWDGADWHEIRTAVSPPPSDRHAMCYDGNRGAVLLVGASDGNAWDFDGVAWRAIGPIPAQPRCVAWDEARRVVALYDGSPTMWEFDGSTWHRRAASSGPTSPFGAAMVFDRQIGRLLLFADESAPPFTDDSWTWDGTGWTRYPTVNTPEPKLRGVGLAHHAAAGHTVVLGGRTPHPQPPASDTWILRYTTPPPAFARIGAGCAGHQGAPTLRSVPDAPYLGEVFRIVVDGVPPDRPTLLWFGAARDVAFGRTLPLDLADFGMPGCALHIRPDLGIAVFNWGGSAAWNFVLPADPALVAQPFYVQALVMDPGINALGMVVSDAMAARMGRR